MGMESSGRSLSGTLFTLLGSSHRFDSEVGTDAGFDEDGEEIQSSGRPVPVSRLRSSRGGGPVRGEGRSAQMGGAGGTMGRDRHPSEDAGAAALDPSRSISSAALLVGGRLSAATSPSSSVLLPSAPRPPSSPRASDAERLEMASEVGKESAILTPTPASLLHVESYQARLARVLFSDASQTSVLCHAPVPTERVPMPQGSGGGGRGYPAHVHGSRSSLSSSLVPPKPEVVVVVADSRPP